MSAARTGDWPLVGHDSDPVPADPSELDEVIAHYKTISEAMTEQAALLKRIGDGDVRLLKGQSADALRKRARESAGALDKAAGRYADVHSALDAYEPSLTTARTDTWNALLEAEKSARELQSAEGMPDPVNATRPDDAKPLTDNEKTQSSDREAAVNAASSGIDGAKQKVAGALEALRVAAEAASTKIRENWKVDDLHTSGWDAFVHRLNKFLKALVEILTYIGMALAVLAILIPGLNVIALIGIGVAVVSVVASTILAAQGEGSWLGVIMGVLSLVGIGIAAKIASKLKGIQAVGLTKAGPVQLKLAKDRIGNLALALRNPLRAPGIFRDALTKSVGNFRSMGDFLLTQRVSPGWWHIFKNPKWVLKEDLTRLRTAWPNGAYRWDRLIGISDIKDISKISSSLGLLGNIYQIKPWMYVGPIAYAVGWFGRPFSMLNPSVLNPFDQRNGNDGWHDANYSGPTSENPI
ncbi:hypothetical protein APR04_000543 [Promicromonospora umidemergens]|uniref:Uncharacterized protein n=1 Tax=Promicromonospora umidemergens TaxID=629679 RepID=A0ABP8XCT2_9MICO|nr:hypothetical protein [Promicromonospora umidemergens]MCP2281654.1 hypothetical protein [Promicromonospora umidemergens]